MPLLVSQLLYTSFPGSGFRLFASTLVPTEIQQAFMQKVVYRYWDSYDPPRAGYRAAYLHQFTLEHSLFGWLYNEGMDELGRCHLPYFLCYYLAEPINAARLEALFVCLQKGPVALIERQNIPDTLETIVIPDLRIYQPARIGVAIPSGVCEQSHIALQQKRLLDLFVSAEEGESSSEIEREHTPDNYTGKALARSQDTLEHSNIESKHMNTEEIEKILKGLISKPVQIEGAALVSSEGQPIATPIGIDENSVLVIAGTMLYLANSTGEEFNWRESEQVSVRGQEGQLILASCSDEVFLLVKAGKVLTGLLEGEINRTVKKLKPELGTSKARELDAETSSELPAQASPRTESEVRSRGIQAL